MAGSGLLVGVVCCVWLACLVGLRGLLRRATPYTCTWEVIAWLVGLCGFPTIGNGGGFWFQRLDAWVDCLFFCFGLYESGWMGLVEFWF
jgi:hypothetical protein